MVEGELSRRYSRKSEGFEELCWSEISTRTFEPSVICVTKDV
jgi:hypothetical protein